MIYIKIRYINNIIICVGIFINMYFFCSISKFIIRKKYRIVTLNFKETEIEAFPISSSSLANCNIKSIILTFFDFILTVPLFRRVQFSNMDFYV